MKIIVRITTVFGYLTVYPVCDTAKLLAALAKTKTLTSGAIGIAEKLGYEIEIKPEPGTWGTA